MVVELSMPQAERPQARMRLRIDETNDVSSKGHELSSYNNTYAFWCITRIETYLSCTVTVSLLHHLCDNVVLHMTQLVKHTYI